MNKYTYAYTCTVCRTCGNEQTKLCKCCNYICEKCDVLFHEEIIFINGGKIICNKCKSHRCVDCISYYDFHQDTIELLDKYFIHPITNKITNILYIQEYDIICSDCYTI
jgi:hypothetical protein